eukprot:gene1123-10637_t
MQKPATVIILLFLIITSVLCEIKECSGRGNKYGDNPNNCHCYDCYEGMNCEIEMDLNTCPLNAKEGNPLNYQDYWKQIEGKPKTTLKSSFRVGYQFNNLINPKNEAVIDKNADYISGNGLNAPRMEDMSETLAKSIRKLHDKYQNVKHEDKYIVFGHGATQLIAASIWALQTIARRKMYVFAKSPFFGGYRGFANTIPSVLQWSTKLDLPFGGRDVIEVVNIPNNPSGERMTPHYNNPNYRIYDLVYYWSCITNTTQIYDENLMLFTLSKLSGHAGSRFGWMFVKDEQVAKLMSSYIRATSVHVSVDAQYKSLVTINHILNDKNKFWQHIESTLKRRWNIILDLFERQNRFSHAGKPNQYFIWVKCNRNENCFQTFLKVGLFSWNGDELIGDHEPKGKYVRLTISLHETSFKIMVHKLRNLMELN